MNLKTICAGGLILFLFVSMTATHSWAGNAAYNRAMELFKALEYLPAQPLFQKALGSGDLTIDEKIKAHESLAEIYVALNQSDKALDQYKEILRLKPDYAISPDSSPKLLDVFTEARVQTPVPIVKNGKEPAIKSMDSRKAMRVAAWICTGVAIAGIGTGAGFYFLGNDKYQEFQDATKKSDADSARDEARTYQTISQAGFGVGLTAGIVAIPLFVYGYKDVETAFFYMPGNHESRFALGIRW